MHTEGGGEVLKQPPGKFSNSLINKNSIKPPLKYLQHHEPPENNFEKEKEKETFHGFNSCTSTYTWEKI